MNNIQQVLSAINKHCQVGRRSLIAIAGPPASGKSTITAELEALLNRDQAQAICAVVPMDGFHYDNAKLDQLGLRDRKGAPETFDSEGFVKLIELLKVDDTIQSIPIFDRTQDAVVPDGKTIFPEQRILLVEGNYLLLDLEPWQRLQDLFDYSIFVNPGVEVLEERLLSRWLKHGFDRAAAQHKTEANDLPNARFVLEHSQKADLLLS